MSRFRRRFAQRSGGATSAQPADYAGLLRWWKADALSLNNNDPVATWTDSSGNGGDATQSTGSLQPLFKTNVLNGKPVVRFDGTDDYMSFTELTTIRTAIIVLKATGNVSYAPLLGGSSTANESFHGGSGAALFEAGWTWTQVLNGSAWINLAKVAAGQIVNMTKPSSFTILSFVTTGGCKANAITKDPFSSSRVWNGDYAEIIIYDQARTDAEIELLISGLKSKWAI